MTTAPTDGRRLPPATRKALLVLHVVVSVGLLGDSAGFMAIAVRAATSTDPALVDASYELLRMFSYVFGIPLSFATVLTGLGLAVGGRWGVLRTPWVLAKLVLSLLVIAIGALVLDGALDAAAAGTGGGTALIAGAAVDVVALVAATALAVYKPGGRGSTRRRRTRAEEAAAPGR